MSEPTVAQPSEKQTTGEIDPSMWQEHDAVTGRPNDVPEENSTFGSRKASVSKVRAPATDEQPAAKRMSKRARRSNARH